MKALAYLNRFFWKYRLRFFSGLLFISISTYFSLKPVEMVGDGVDYVVNAMKLGTSGDAVRHELLIMCLEIIGYTLAFGVFLFLNRQTIIVMSRLIEYDMKNEIFDHYQKLDQGFYKRNNTGDLMNRISEDVGRVRMYIGPAVMYTANTIISLVMTISFMVKEDPIISLWVLAPLPVLAITIYFVSNLINRKSLKVQAQLSKLSTSAQETFSGIRVVKTFSREEHIQEKFDAEAESYKNLNMGLIRTEALFQPFMVFMIGLSIVITVYFAGNAIIDGKLAVGTISSFMLYVIRLTWPIASLGWVTSLVQRAAASQQRINEFLQTKPAIENPTQEPLDLKGKIEFKNVSFTYSDSGINALRDVSFAVEPGQSVAFIGRTGSGKSTVAQLLLRLSDVSTGNILIDGKDIREVNLGDLREKTGYVPQEVFLFSETIAGNIGFSTHDLRELEKNRDVIEQAAKDAAIYSNIMEFLNGFDTMVGERG
ncbi:MAG: ABC transporter ATP-binding protein, partial [Bacteroidia bacterium]